MGYTFPYEPLLGTLLEFGTLQWTSTKGQILAGINGKAAEE